MQVFRKQNLVPNIEKHAQQSMLRSKHEQQLQFLETLPKHSYCLFDCKDYIVSLL